MEKFKTFALTVLFLIAFALPAVSSAAALTEQQSISIIGVVQSSPGTAASAFVPLIIAFSNITANQAASLIGVVQSSPGTPAAAFVDLLTSFTVDAPADPAVVNPPASAQQAIPHLSSVGTPYIPSNLGYDLSYSTSQYPGVMFNFGVIGVTGGRAFVDNPRLSSEVAWAQVSSARAPTAYMNLNAPYGSTVAANIGGPKSCPTSVSTSTDPTACQGYNYGYNAAAHSFAYAAGNSINTSLWWLDIEEANSWSPDTSVNDATIQGAIDYLNAKGIRVGIYSVPYMWDDIAGTAFVPNQSVNGVAVTTPNWFPIGTATQIEAINACVTRNGFISGSPIWLIQYEADSSAVDQNIAC
ncbi:MAG: hypothetical protein WAN50_04375 [Minisyncoccia bacterium]